MTRRKNATRRHGSGIRSGYAAMRTYNTAMRFQKYGLRGLVIRLINKWIGRTVWHASSPLYLTYGKKRRSK